LKEKEELKEKFKAALEDLKEKAFIPQATPEDRRFLVSVQNYYVNPPQNVQNVSKDYKTPPQGRGNNRYACNSQDPLSK